MILNTVVKNNRHPNFMAYLCLAIVCVLWGTTWVVSAWATRQQVAPLQIAAMRQVVAGIFFVATMLVYHKGKLKMPTIKDTLILSFINFICSNGLSTWEVKYIPGGLAAIMAAVYPIYLVIIYYIFFAKNIAKEIWLSMLIALIGIILIFYPSLTDKAIDRYYVFGVALAIISSITWAFGTIYTKRQANRDNINPYFSIGLQMLISGVTLNGGLIVTGQYTSVWSMGTDVWIAIAYLIVAGSIAGYACFLYALKSLPAEQVSIYAYINPIVALFFSNMFMDEPLSSMLLIGTVFVLAGVYMLNKYSASL
jgi:drug/metabolite transporter (DMT)-like permease